MNGNCETKETGITEMSMLEVAGLMIREMRGEEAAPIVDEMQEITWWLGQWMPFSPGESLEQLIRVWKEETRGEPKGSL